MDNEKNQEFINAEAEKLHTLTGISFESAGEVIQSRVDRVLDDRDILFFEDRPDQFIKIEQLLDAGDKYHAKKFLEPLPTREVVEDPGIPGVKETCWFKWNDWNPVMIGNCSSVSKEFVYQFKRFEEIKATKKFKFMKADKLPQYQPDWLIRDYIEAEKVALFFGAPASFKSFMAIDMGLSIATGKDWHGHKVNQGAVLYICGEGQSGIHKRILAWEKHHNQCAENFFVSSQPVQILSEKSLKEIEAAAENIPDNAPEPKVIIIDTLNRNFGDGDENSTLDMTKFIQGIDQLSHRLKCAIIVVHHSGLADAGRSRGSSALRGAMDFEYSCKVDKSHGDKLITLESTKTKDHVSPDPKMFRPIDVVIGKDGDGHSISSVVLVENSLPSNVIKLAKGPRVALDALQAVAANGPAAEDAWKAEAYALNISPSEKLGTRRKAFVRAKKELLDQGLVSEIDGKYFVA